MNLFQLAFCHQGNSGQELKAETPKQSSERNPAYSPTSPDLLFYFSYTSEAHIPRDGTTYSEPDSPVFIRKEENALQTSTQAILLEAIPQLRLFSHVCKFNN